MNKEDYSKCDNFKYALTPKQLKAQLDKIALSILKDDIDISCCERIITEEFNEGFGISKVSEHKVVLLQEKDSKEFVKVLKIRLEKFYFCNRTDLIPQDMPYRYIHFKLKE